MENDTAMQAQEEGWTDLDIPLAVLLGAGGVDLAGGVGAAACWEQPSWRRPRCSTHASGPTPPTTTLPQA